MLVDTDVLIWYLRGNEGARSEIHNIGAFSVSVVTQIELVQGMRNRRELAAFRRTALELRMSVLQIDCSISSHAAFLVEEHFLSHRLELADALIAATALSRGEPLLTGNVKHYRPVRGLALKPFRP